MSELGRILIEKARGRLSETLLPQISAALETLGEEGFRCHVP